MHYQRRSIAPRVRTALAWAFGLFAVLQLTLSIVMDSWQPELRDPEFGYKLTALRERLQEAPGRPLMLVLGSSRTGLGFSPQAFSDCMPEKPDKPIVFNFGMTGAGPFMNFMCLRRLIRAGIHPRWLAIEVLPPVLHQDLPWGEAVWLDINRLGWNDLSLLRHNTHDTWKRYRNWIGSRLVPWSTHRFCVLTRYFPEWVPLASRQDGWKTMDRFGWLPFTWATVTPEQYRNARDFAHDQYEPALFRFHVTEMPDRILRRMIELCHREQITPLLVLMPEGAEFQSWYTADALAEINAYMSRLSSECQVPVIDARRWVADFAFMDSHHLLPDGAIDFSRRLARDYLAPLIAGKSLSGMPAKLVANP